MGSQGYIEKLLERISTKIDLYKSESYNETQVRIEYIDLLFMALDPDVYNAKGHNEAYKDVIRATDMFRVFPMPD